MSDEADYSNDPIIKFFAELFKVKKQQRLLVILTHGFLELLINTLVDAKCKNSKKIASNHRDYPHSAKLLLLNEKDVIPDQFYRTLDWFRKLRNRAAHDPFFVVTKNDLSFLSNEKFHNPKNFDEFCIALVGGFWNDHIDIFLPVFAPNIHKPKVHGEPETTTAKKGKAHPRKRSSSRRR